MLKPPEWIHLIWNPAQSGSHIMGAAYVCLADSADIYAASYRWVAVE